jgi:hypothetical protein
MLVGPAGPRILNTQDVIAAQVQILLLDVFVYCWEQMLRYGIRHQQPWTIYF